MPTNDLATKSSSSPTLPNPVAPEMNFAKTGQNGTFGDIDPNYALSNAQCRAIELALDGFRWSQIANILSLDRKTLWRWKTQDIDFQQALADAQADRHRFAAERCQTLAIRAAAILAKFLEDPMDKNRMRAAQLLLQAAARFKPPLSRVPFTDSTYPAPPILTPPPFSTNPDPYDDNPFGEPDLEPKVG